MRWTRILEVALRDEVRRATDRQVGKSEAELHVARVCACCADRRARYAIEAGDGTAGLGA